MGVPDEGGDYASIDVDAYGEAVDDLEKTHAGIRDHILHLESDFGFFGVSMSNFNKLKSAKTALDEQLPGLRRRHSLALQLLEEQQGQGWAGDGVISFTGDILNDDFSSVEEAQQAGKDAADLVGEDGEIPEEVYEQLEKYGHDPDFAEAFINALSPRERAILLNQTGYGENGELNEQQLALAKTLETASYRIDYDAEFLNEMAESLQDDIPGIGTGTYINIMAAYMQEGTWSHESLVAFGEAVFDKDVVHTGQGPDWANVMAALGRNPRASAEFMHRNQDDIWELATLYGPATDSQEWDEAFSKFIKSATVDSRSIYARLALSDDSQANLTEENASYLINQIAQQKEGEEWPFSDNMRGVFADITEEYWDEFMYVFSSPAGTATYPDGTPIPIDGIDPKAWDAFITEAMRSDEPMARILGLIGEQQQSTRDSRTGDNNATGWDGYINGRLSDFFLANFNQIMGERDADDAARDEARNNLISFLVGAGFDPQGVGKDLAKQFITSLVQSIASDLSEEETEQLDTSVLGYHEAWRDYANTRLREGEIEPYDDGTVTWDGDPEFYEEHYGGKFTDSSGQILPLDEIRADPDALRAYNAWLQDPAVQRATNPFFQDENLPGDGG